MKMKMKKVNFSFDIQPGNAVGEISIMSLLGCNFLKELWPGCQCRMKEGYIKNGQASFSFLIKC